MDKPVKPNITIPESFAKNGIKTDFDSDLMTEGFDSLKPDVLAGDNLNKFIDDTYKGLNYGMAAADAINLINEGETLTVQNGQLVSGSTGGGLEVCDIGMSLYVDETKGLRRYINGQIVDRNTNTETFFTRLQQITTLHPSLLDTEENWQAAKALSPFGQVGKFVFNYSGDEIVSVRLPRVVNVQGLFDLQNLGMTVSAGLPNITGSTSFDGSSGVIVKSTAITSGSIYKGTTRSKSLATYSAQGSDIAFDASLSNQIYGNSNTVQQEAIQYPYFIQIATGSETENNIINEIELNNPYSLFDSKYSDHELNNLSWLKSEGQWNVKAVYTDAYDELLTEYNDSASVEETEGSITFKRTPKGYKIALANQETAIDTKYAADGIAWYYILDTTNEKFKLPRTKFGFKGLRNNVGNDIAESLPNIKGYVGYIARTTNDSTIGQSGAFYDNGASAGLITTQQAARSNLGFNASLFSSTYQDNAPVQERATQMYLYFYVGETAQNANLIDAGRIGEQLTTKTDMLQASGAGMPSDKYIDLTLGASGTTYTAPANGWVYFARKNINGYVALLTYINNDKNNIKMSTAQATTSGVSQCYIPVRKGDEFGANYSGGEAYFFRFIYAEGSK